MLALWIMEFLPTRWEHATQNTDTQECYFVWLGKKTPRNKKNQTEKSVYKFGITLCNFDIYSWKSGGQGPVHHSTTWSHRLSIPWLLLQSMMWVLARPCWVKESLVRIKTQQNYNDYEYSYCCWKITLTSNLHLLQMWFLPQRIFDSQRLLRPASEPPGTMGLLMWLSIALAGPRAEKTTSNTYVWKHFLKATVEVYFIAFHILPPPWITFLKNRLPCSVFLIRPFWTMMRRLTFLRTWTRTPPMMCQSPPSTQMSLRAKTCLAPKGHVRWLKQSPMNMFRPSRMTTQYVRVESWCKVFVNGEYSACYVQWRVRPSSLFMFASIVPRRSVPCK